MKQDKNHGKKKAENSKDNVKIKTGSYKEKMEIYKEEKKKEKLNMSRGLGDCNWII